MEMISVTEASKEKRCSDQAIRDAIKKSILDAVRFGRTYAIKKNKKYSEWMPNPKIQQAGKARWESATL